MPVQIWPWVYINITNMKNFKIEITTNAEDHLNFLKKNTKNINYRIFSRNLKNNDELLLCFSYCLYGEENITDKKFLYTNFTIYVENLITKKIPLISIHYDDMNKKLILKVSNLYKKNNKLEEIKLYVLNNINPILKQHNGYIEVTNLIDNTLFIKLHGSCAQCMLSTNTFNNFIKKKILKRFINIKKIENIITK